MPRLKVITSAKAKEVQRLKVIASAKAKGYSKCQG